MAKRKQSTVKVGHRKRTIAAGADKKLTVSQMRKILKVADPPTKLAASDEAVRRKFNKTFGGTRTASFVSQAQLRRGLQAGAARDRMKRKKRKSK